MITTSLDYRLEKLEHLRQEVLGTRFLRIAEDFIRCPVFHDVALVHKEYTATHFTGKTHFVGNNHHGHTGFGELTNNRLYFTNHFWVKR